MRHLEPRVDSTAWVGQIFIDVRLQLGQGELFECVVLADVMAATVTRAR